MKATETVKNYLWTGQDIKRRASCSMEGYDPSQEASAPPPEAPMLPTRKEAVCGGGANQLARAFDDNSS